METGLSLAHLTLGFTDINLFEPGDWPKRELRGQWRQEPWTLMVPPVPCRLHPFLGLAGQKTVTRLLFSYVALGLLSNTKEVTLKELVTLSSKLPWNTKLSALSLPRFKSYFQSCTEPCKDNVESLWCTIFPQQKCCSRRRTKEEWYK